MVLVHVEIAARDQLEVEGGMEGEQRQQVVEEADAGRDANPARAVEIEGEPQRRLGRRAGNIGAAARRRPGLGAERAQDDVVLERAAKRDPDAVGEAADDEPLLLEPLAERLAAADPDEVRERRRAVVARREQRRSYALALGDRLH